jgi:predicted NBD/HSP70 family sugar kinase
MRGRPIIRLTGDQKRIVWHLRASGPQSRSDIAAHLDTNNATMTKLSRDLIDLGVIEELPPEPGREQGRGRPSVPLRVSPAAGYAAGATVHPGWLEIMLVDFAGSEIAHVVKPFESPDPRAFAKAVEAELTALVAANFLMRSRFLGLGIAAAGPVVRGDMSRRRTVDWLHGWREIDQNYFFADYLGMAVWTENDGTLAALGEYYHSGLIQRCQSAIAFFIGHGVAGGVVSGRDILRGEFGNAGEIGKQFASAAPRPSGIDLMKCLRAAGAEIDSLLQVEACLVTHRPIIDAWINRAGSQLASAANAGIAWLDAGAIIVSGALPLPVLAGLTARIAEGDWATGHSHLSKPELYTSQLGSKACVLGAALMPIHATTAAAH